MKRKTLQLPVQLNEESEKFGNPAYTTIQNAIYNPIRYILGVHKINTLRGKRSR